MALDAGLDLDQVGCFFGGWPGEFAQFLEEGELPPLSLIGNEFKWLCLPRSGPGQFVQSLKEGELPCLLGGCGALGLSLCHHFQSINHKNVVKVDFTPGPLAGCHSQIVAMLVLVMHTDRLIVNASAATRFQRTASRVSFANSSSILTTPNSYRCGMLSA